jgi:hypothetical protein
MPAKKKLDFKIDANGCFILTSHRLNGDGYGYLYVDGKEQRAHRFIYRECFGEIPKGLVVRHKCDVRACINPEHLEIGSVADNSRDAVERKRTAYGERNGRAVITEETAKKIKGMISDGATNNEIMQRVGVKQHTVRRIRENRAWKYIDL